MKEYKKIKKAYEIKLHKLQKNNASCTEYFVTKLQYIRDRLILTTNINDIKKGTGNPQLVLLTTALKEYDNYKTCFKNYFSIDNNKKLYPKDSLKKEEAYSKWTQEKVQHWINFWELVKLNLEDWEEADATI